MTVDELQNIAIHFNVPLWAFFSQTDMDDEVFAECYRMFTRDAFALDRIIEAAKLDPKNLRKLGELADEMRRAHNREKRKHDSQRG